jgi:hypothetical protein
VVEPPIDPRQLADQLLSSDPILRKLTDIMARRQQRLKRALTPEQFRLYLLLEEAVNERFMEAHPADTDAVRTTPTTLPAAPG